MKQQQQQRQQEVKGDRTKTTPSLLFTLEQHMTQFCSFLQPGGRLPEQVKQAQKPNTPACLESPWVRKFLENLLTASNFPSSDCTFAYERFHAKHNPARKNAPLCFLSDAGFHPGLSNTSRHNTKK